MYEHFIKKIEFAKNELEFRNYQCKYDQSLYIYIYNVIYTICKYGSHWGIKSFKFRGGLYRKIWWVEILDLVPCLS